MDTNWRDTEQPSQKRFVMEYHCGKCNEMWTDMWFHVVDDCCPRCGVATGPLSVEDITIQQAEQGE